MGQENIKGEGCWFCALSSGFEKVDDYGLPLDQDPRYAPAGRKKGYCQAAAVGVSHLQEGNWERLNNAIPEHPVSSQGVCNLARISKNGRRFNLLFTPKETTA